MKKKVEIIIREKDEKGNPCILTNGEPYISVDFNTNRYGAGSPCKNEEEVLSSIKHQKEWIIREGDIPVIIDLRENKKVGQMTLI